MGSQTVFARGLNVKPILYKNPFRVVELYKNPKIEEKLYKNPRLIFGESKKQ